MTVQELGKLIQFRRDFLNLRQGDLAELSGVTTKTIHLIEAGTGNPSLETMEKLAHVLGMEILLQVKKSD